MNPSGKTSLPRDLFTLYGRQPVLEALQNPAIQPYKLHLADSNRSGGSLDDILKLADKREVPLAFHTRLALSRISRNGKQDQGVALDIRMPNLKTADTLCNESPSTTRMRFLALDQITNPQNVGMILRSAAAGGVDGVIIPKQGCARLDSLVIKASSGTFFRAPIYLCDNLPSTLKKLASNGMQICLMTADAKQTLFTYKLDQSCVFVLGNETEGVSKDIRALPHKAISIPMHNGVESLNVAMTATLIAYHNE